MFGGVKEPLIISGLKTVKNEPPSPSQNLLKDCKPVASKSRHYTDNDKKFISVEVEQLFSEGINYIMKRSQNYKTSPWRSQIVVT